MEKQKISGAIVATIITLSVLVLVLGGYIGYDKLLKNKDNTNDTNITNNDVIKANDVTTNTNEEKTDDVITNTNEEKTNETVTNTSEEITSTKTIIVNDAYSLPLNSNPATRAVLNIYKVKDLYVETIVDETAQCAKTKVIIIANHGNILKEVDLANANININDDTITINYTKSCQSSSSADNAATLKYQVNGSSIIEK